MRRVNEMQRTTYSWARRVVDIIRKSLAHARAPESGLEAWVEAILNAEEHRGSWCKKDLEKDGCSHCNVHVDLQHIWVIQPWVKAGEGHVKI